MSKRTSIPAGRFIRIHKDGTAVVQGISMGKATVHALDSKRVVLHVASHTFATGSRYSMFPPTTTPAHFAVYAIEECDTEKLTVMGVVEFDVRSK